MMTDKEAEALVARLPQMAALANEIKILSIDLQGNFLTCFAGLGKPAVMARLEAEQFNGMFDALEAYRDALKACHAKVTKYQQSLEDRKKD